MSVVSHRSMRMTNRREIGDPEPRVAYQESRKVDTPEADALFLSGANWRTIQARSRCYRGS